MQSSLGVNVVFFWSEPTGTQTNITTKEVRSYSIHRVNMGSNLYSNDADSILDHCSIL